MQHLGWLQLRCLHRLSACCVCVFFYGGGLRFKLVETLRRRSERLNGWQHCLIRYVSPHLHALRHLTICYLRYATAVRTAPKPPTFCQDMTGPPGGADPALAGGNAHHSVAVGAGCQRLSDVACAKAAEGRFVLTLGGDHSVALGSVAGVLRARPNTRVLWVDAHADLNTPEGSPSGNMHGEFLD